MRKSSDRVRDPNFGGPPCTETARTLKVDPDPNDLQSPFDGKPLSYRFQAWQMVITLRRSGYEENAREFKVPPDRDQAFSGGSLDRAVPSPSA